jgi:transposase
MRREYAWAPRGQRAVSKKPYNNWQTVSIIGGIRLGTKPRIMTHHGSVKAPTFRRFVRRTLVPWLRAGDLVIMDNLNIHKGVAVREAIIEAGATPVYLPTYSPELNPIELLWGWLKRVVRSLEPNNVDEVRRAVRRARAQVPLAHVSAWFRRALGCAAQIK